MPAAEVQENNLAKFGQKHATNTVVLTAASELANPLANTVVLLATAGVNGGMLTSLSYIPLGTVTDSAVLMYVEKAASAVKTLKDAENLPGWSKVTTAKAPRGAFRYGESASYRMEAGDKVYMGLSGAQGSGVAASAEWTNF